MDSATLAYLQGLLPDSVRTLVDEHVLRDDAAVPQWTRALADQAAHVAGAARPYTTPLTAQATSALAALAARATALLTPLLDRAARAAYAAPDAVVLLGALVLVLVLLQALALLRRLLAWWTRLLFRAVFWSAVAVAAAAVWQRGLAQSAQDAAALVGRLLGYAAFVGDIWRAEYDKYQQQQVLAQAAVNGGGGGGGRRAWSGR